MLMAGEITIKKVWRFPSRHLKLNRWRQTSEETVYNFIKSFANTKEKSKWPHRKLIKDINRHFLFTAKQTQKHQKPIKRFSMISVNKRIQIKTIRG